MATNTARTKYVIFQKCFIHESRLSFEDLEAFKDIFKAIDISESDSKPYDKHGGRFWGKVFCLLSPRRNGVKEYEWCDLKCG